MSDKEELLKRETDEAAKVSTKISVREENGELRSNGDAKEREENAVGGGVDVKPRYAANGESSEREPGEQAARPAAETYAGAFSGELVGGVAGGGFYGSMGYGGGTSNGAYGNYTSPRFHSSYQQLDQQIAGNTTSIASQHQQLNVGQFPGIPILSQPGPSLLVPQQLPSQQDGQMNYMFKVGRPKTKLEEYSRKFNSQKLKDLKSRPYACSFPGCDWAFARQSDLRRHAKSHAEPSFHCPYWRNDPTCHHNGGAFNRLDVLKRHLRLVHYVQDKQSVVPGSKEDPGWCRACQRMFPNSKIFIEHCLECAQSLSPTEWKNSDNVRYQQIDESEAPNQSAEYQTDEQIYELPKMNSITDEKENYFLNPSNANGITAGTSSSNNSKRKNTQSDSNDTKKAKRTSSDD